MLDNPEIIQTEAQFAAVIRLTAPRHEIPHVMGPGIGELMAAITSQGQTPTGPIFSHHLRMDDPRTFDFEIGVPVASPITAVGRVEPSQSPAATVARTVDHGPYEGLGPAGSEFEAWVAAQGRTLAPDLWECYLSGPELGPDPTSWRTQLSRPLIR